MPTNGFAIKPLKVKLLAGEQKATEFRLCAVLKFCNILKFTIWTRVMIWLVGWVAKAEKGGQI